jgi:hypothetical protein
MLVTNDLQVAWSWPMVRRPIISGIDAHDSMFVYLIVDQVSPIARRRFDRKSENDQNSASVQGSVDRGPKR